jgi:hypothetical protein
MHSPAPLSVELVDEPLWRGVRLLLVAVATAATVATASTAATAVAGFGWAAPVFEFTTQAATHRGDGTLRAAGSGGLSDFSPQSTVLGVCLAVAVLGVLAWGWWCAWRLRRPQPSGLLVWDGRAWSWAVMEGCRGDAQRKGDASSGSAAPSGRLLEPVEPRISLDLGAWMLLRIERQAARGLASGSGPRVLWRALSRRGAPAVWVPLRAALWATR